MSLSANTIFICVMSIERYIAVHYPLNAKAWVTPSRAKKVILKKTFYFPCFGSDVRWALMSLVVFPPGDGNCVALCCCESFTGGNSGNWVSTVRLQCAGMYVDSPMISCRTLVAKFFTISTDFFMTLSTDEASQIHQQLPIFGQMYWTMTALLILTGQYILFGGTTFVLYVAIMVRVLRTSDSRKQLSENSFLASQNRLTFGHRILEEQAYNFAKAMSVAYTRGFSRARESSPCMYECPMWVSTLSTLHGLPPCFSLSWQNSKKLIYGLVIVRFFQILVVLLLACGRSVFIAIFRFIADREQDEENNQDDGDCHGNLLRGLCSPNCKCAAELWSRC